MEFGDKLDILRERADCKNYADFGKKLGLPGDWLLELRKRKDFKTVNLERLMVIADYFHITLDQLLRDSEDNYVINTKEGLNDNDIGVMLNKIQDQLKQDNNRFYDIEMNSELSQITIDALDVVKQLIKQII